MKSFLSALEGWAEFLSLEEGLRGGVSGQRVAGLGGTAKAYVLAGLFARLGRPGVIITSDIQEAARLYDDIAALLKEENPRLLESLLLFPSYDTTLFEDSPPDRDVLRDRLKGLWRLAQGGKLLVVTTPDGIFGQTLPKERLVKSALEIKRGATVPREELAALLVDGGYERTELVEMPGDFSLRGDVIDVWPSTLDGPVRIEQFDEEVESIRTFDPSSQRSKGGLEAVTILPAREMLLTPDDTETAYSNMAIALEGQVARLEAAGKHEEALMLAERVRDDLASLSQQAYRRGAEYYLPYIWPDQTMLTDYLPDEALVVWDEPERTEEEYGKFLAEVDEMYQRRREGGLLLDLPKNIYLELANGKSCLGERQDVELRLMSGGAGPEIVLESGPAENFAANTTLLVNGLKEAQGRGDLVVASTRQAQRVWELLSESGLRRIHMDYETKPGPGDIMIAGAPLSAGFRIREIKLAVFTDGELFGWKRPPRAGPKRRDTVTITSLSQLKEGDYVVHIHHGIGVYQGLVRQTIDEAEREFLLIQYAANDKLYVPADQFDRVQKYVGGEAEVPTLSRLGGKEWERTKRKAQKSAKDLAGELVKLYAARSREEGHAFSPDTPWQMEMEAGFPYEETDDQLQALGEVKEDMEKINPMDRLVCGDVGFGKTEVAIRAAFKAVMDGKQVAVLVPTTILASQHFHTLRDRMAPYPMRVEMLSRFRSAKDIKQTVEDLAEGAVDIVVGTHRLLSKDIQFKDLGLMIIDEEQRFGVRHKERLKQLRSTVDCLTLTATPIPRTMHMALGGLREMSLINDPPEGRRPVRTQAAPRSDALIIEAIQRELDRGGQVYYVHNRIESIYHIADHLQRILPEARIIIGHGQMAERELEQVMVDFYAGRFDVLLCTTIIENGLDIPNVNTIIIDNADKLGLAQLYQLRGRVGRSDRQAYAYFMWTPHKKMTETAQQRIQALKEFTDLGSGLKLALRDLEIRGAGNLLGPEQHGFVAAVGFDLFSQMLAEEVSEARGLPVKARPEVSLDLPVDAYIPDEWVPGLNQRIEIYRRLAGVTDEQALEELAAEMKDRFGAPLPRPVINLARMVRIKLLCTGTRIERVAAKSGGDLTFLLSGAPLVKPEIRELRVAFVTAGGLLREAFVEPLRVTVPLQQTRGEDIFRVVEPAVQVLALLPKAEKAAVESAV